MLRFRRSAGGLRTVPADRRLGTMTFFAIFSVASC